MTLEDQAKAEAHARNLIISAQHAAQRINDAVFQVGEFRRWPNESMVIATVYLAAGFANTLSLSQDDFLLLCRIAHDTVRAEPKTAMVTP
jgi:hypothetical protein